IGRERAANVLDTAYDRTAIAAALDKALTDAAFKRALATIQPPFGDGTAYRRITEVLARLTIDDRLLNKRMSY
ncbi:MAG: UDP-N-acetylglucosamine 2-epimerase (hydrolyzing), partial [Alphaproteobacteria bacterium]|nr:UDP-N-acetylglucosamine 2-epimerase (hydrolyzing) [Alphaproteobacteria bacterium]